MYKSMNGVGYYGFGNQVPISALSFLIDTLAAHVAKEQIYALFVVRSMSITSNRGTESQRPMSPFLRHKADSRLQVREGQMIHFNVDLGPPEERALPTSNKPGTMTDRSHPESLCRYSGF